MSGLSAGGPSVSGAGAAGSVVHSPEAPWPEHSGPALTSLLSHPPGPLCNIVYKNAVRIAPLRPHTEVIPPHSDSSAGGELASATGQL